MVIRRIICGNQEQKEIMSRKEEVQFSWDWVLKSGGLQPSERLGAETDSFFNAPERVREWAEKKGPQEELNLEMGGSISYYFYFEEDKSQSCHKICDLDSCSLGIIRTILSGTEGEIVFVEKTRRAV